MARVARADRTNTVRPPLMQGRRAEATTDVSLLPIADPERDVSQLRAPDGSFYFLLGYSQLDGPDVLR